jgi:hypothetical protein
MPRRHAYLDGLLVAGIGGLAKIFASELVGALALLPGLLAIFATTMKLQAKANQYYRRKDALLALYNRLKFELPDPPQNTDIADISRAWGELTSRMNDEWERSLQFDWAHFALPSAPEKQSGTIANSPQSS